MKISLFSKKNISNINFFIMKFFNHVSILIIICLVLVGCSKKDSPEPESRLLGEWVNKENPKDIIFFEKNIIRRTDLVHGGFNHKYDYQIIGDRISLKYNGINYILVPEVKFQYILNAEKNHIEIKNIHTYFPQYEGDIFIRKNN